MDCLISLAPLAKHPVSRSLFLHRSRSPHCFQLLPYLRKWLEPCFPLALYCELTFLFEAPFIFRFSFKYMCSYKFLSPSFFLQFYSLFILISVLYSLPFPIAYYAFLAPYLARQQFLFVVRPRFLLILRARQ